MKELEYIKWLMTVQSQDTMANRAHITIPNGDDCAEVTTVPGARLLLAADMLMDEVHFRIGDASPEEIGHKSLAVNLSDIAAMAGVPSYALVCLGIPRNLAEKSRMTSQTFLQRFHHGMKALASRYQVDIVGGDTNVSEGIFTVAVTIIGQSPATGAISRSGAKVRDWIFVTGPLGGSQSGKHLSFEPRIKEAHALHAAATLHAMIDISDGLATDLKHIMKLSKVGAELIKTQIPLTPELRGPKNQSIEEALKKALTDGEDFELCFTVSETDGKALLRQSSGDLSMNLTHIGYITNDHELRWDDGTPIHYQGYEHTCL